MNIVMPCVSIYCMGPFAAQLFGTFVNVLFLVGNVDNVLGL